MRTFILLAVCLAVAVPLRAQTLPFSDSFAQQDGLITNEWAYAHPNSTDALVSSDWTTPSGSLLVQGGIGWTGVPDDTPANPRSTSGTHSAVFRLLTNRGDFGDVSISFDLLNEGLTAGDTTPAEPWDGCDIVARYQSEQRFYYASVDRRDGTALIKKKVGDTFYDLTPAAAAAVPYGMWQKVQFIVNDNPDGTVSLALYRDKILLAQAVDTGAAGGPPYRGVGKVGLRGDNARLKFGHFHIETLTGPAVASAPAPAITSIQVVGVADSSATLTFNTSLESFDHVEYGQTISYGFETPWSDAASIGHSILLWGLQPSTPYHYKIWVKSRAGAQSSMGDMTFTTAAQANTVPPNVSIISPANGQTLSGTIPIVAMASSPAANVAVMGVSFEIDGNLVGPEITQPPFTYIWPSTTALNGPHTLRAIARDASNNRGVSNMITITITGGL